MIKKKIDSEVTKLVLFIVIIFIIQLSIDIIIDNFSEDIFNKFKPYKHWVAYFLLTLTGIWLRKTIHASYDSEINLLNDKLKDESKIIWEKYHDLHEFKKDKVIIKHLEEFITTEPQVIAMQIYSYNSFIKRNIITFKTNLKYGFIEEGNSINAVMQEYFKINKSIYRKFNDAIESSDIDKKLGFIFKRINTFISKENRFNSESKRKPSYNELDCSNFHVAKLVVESLIRNSGLNVESIISKEFEEKMENMKKGGIFRSILTSDFYYFESQKDLKNNRVYLSKRIFLDKKPCVVLITLHKDPSLKDDYMYDIFSKYLSELNKICILDMKGGVNNDKY